jgi:hypothetical protein
MTAHRHTSADFLRFLDQLVATASRRRAIHIIADNVSAHKPRRSPTGSRPILGC